MPKMTATHFYRYLTCPLALWFDVHGDEKRKLPPSDFEKTIWERGAAHEKRVLAKMGLKEVIDDDPDEAVATTLDLMGKGVPIYHGRLADGEWLGIPDFLIPEKGHSRLGPFVYAPLDVKSATDVRDEHRFQLVFYALLLERIQGVRPKYGYIVNAHEERIAIPIEPLVEEFHATRAEVEKILNGEKPAPFFSSSCKQTPWFEACRDEAVSCNDVSLIYRIRRDDYAKLREAGIITVNDMADADLTALRRKTDLPIGRLERLRDHAICYVQNTHAVIDRPEFPTASVEVYYDVESDTVPEPNLHYLHGALVVKNGKATYKKFLVRNPKDEGKVWRAFCAWVAKLPKDAAIYHYGMYEHMVVRELTERHDAPKEALLRFGDMIDLQKTAARSVLFPVYFYSLKDLAKYLGFKWRTKGATGGASVEWYNAWRKKKDAATLKKIVEYNEDDVRATRVLKDFLAGL